MSERRLIVNADDLGWTPGVNDGILTAHLEGVVSSATLMVNAPGAEHAAAALARPQLSRLGVGLHLALSGAGPTALPPSRVPSLVDADGRLPRRPEGLAGARAEEILSEVRAQLERFHRLLGRAPTHFDGHHHCHRRPEVFAAVLTVAAESRLPVRAVTPDMRQHLRAAAIATPDAFDESFYGAGVSAEHLAERVRAAAQGVTEIMCHPGRVDDELRRSSTYVDDREREIAILTDPALARLLAAENIRLVSYSAL